VDCLYLGIMQTDRPGFVPSDLPFFVQNPTEEFRAQAGLRLLEWALDEMRREALETGDPAALRAWAESAGSVDDDELGVGD
jgi:hypothetical protein